MKMRSETVMLDTGVLLLEARLGSTETLNIGDNIKFYGTLQIRGLRDKAQPTISV